MNDDRTLERLIASSYDSSAPSREPAGLLDDVLLLTSRSRQRPRWLALIKEPPMRLTSGLAVGSSTARVAALVAASLLLLILATGAVVAGSALLGGSAPLIVVAQDGSGDYETISAAVAAAEDGATITVEAGTYTESVVIDTKNVIIDGDAAEGEVVVRFSEDGPTVPSFTEFGPVPYGFLLVDTETTLSDLTINGPIIGMGIAMVAGGPTVDRVVVDLDDPVFDSPHAAFGLANMPAATIRDSRGDGPIWTIGNLAEYGSLLGTGPLTLEGNEAPAIWVTVTDGAVVSDNRLVPYDAFAAGSDFQGMVPTIELELHGGGSARVSGNTSSALVLLGDGSGVIVSGNTVDGGSQDLRVGIQLAGGSPTVDANTIRGARVGIVVPRGGTPTITSNVIEGNETGIAVNDTTLPDIEDNRFCENEKDLGAPEGSTVSLDPSNEFCRAPASTE